MIRYNYMVLSEVPVDNPGLLEKILKDHGSHGWRVLTISMKQGWVIMEREEPTLKNNA